MTQRDPRLVHDVLPVLLWTVGPDGACDYLNHRWAEFTGRSVPEMLGWRWIESLHPDDREGFQTEYAAALAARAPFRYEFRMLHQDGEYRWLLSLGEPVLGPGGEFLGYSGCSTDVSDRRTLEERLAQLDRAGEIAQLAGGIAHDFNNLLTGILGHVGLLLDEGSLPPEAREDLDQIRQAADRAATLSRHLLAFSRKPPPAPQSLDLNQLLSNTLSAVRQVVGTAIEVRYEPADGLEPALADPSRIEQILLQLASRARLALPRGGTFRLQTGRLRVDGRLADEHPGLRPGTYVTLQIGFQGPELDSAALVQTFESSPDRPPGERPSLAGIVRQSGGYLTVDASSESGAVFSVCVPRFDPPRVADAPAAEFGGDETILLAEDDAHVREVARRALERAGYLVLPVSDAEAAVAAADRHPGHIHLLITDVVLPRVSGRELAARLAIHRPAIKVLYVSGTSDGAIARHRMLEPDIAFLEKPFSLDRFLRKVRQALGANPSADDQATWT
ncbi:MAG TPA: PAS domain-containing protein, partial [Gemmatimonadales bacterium]|nr:PAS domain-containing protein [Gemmatimonadales bacterium]